MKTELGPYRLAVLLLSALFLAVYTLASRQSIALKGRRGGESNMTKKLVKSDGEWQKTLTSEQYRILRKCGTERAFTGKYWDHHEDGVYSCAGCGQTLFASEDKFDSGSGWPSFREPGTENSVSEHTDNSLGMSRTEVKCSRCGGHLGHVFNDGPKPTGLRYCINSAALNFSRADKPVKKIDDGLETATFGAGCFWCTDAAFELLDGVESVKVGYMGGHVDKPTYKQVCTGRTGHAEVAQIKYDPKRVSFADLLDIFWIVHDPTTLNRQGGDVGTQYRSVIFYHTPEQKEAAEKAKRKLDAEKKFQRPIVTEITKASEFFEAENCHQDYYSNNSAAPYCQAVIAPKLKNVRDATQGTRQR